MTYAAYPGETAVFSSGREITGWRKVPPDLPRLPKKAAGNVWVADVPGRFSSLYDADGLLPRALFHGRGEAGIFFGFLTAN